MFAVTALVPAKVPALCFNHYSYSTSVSVDLLKMMPMVLVLWTLFWSDALMEESWEMWIVLCEPLYQTVNWYLWLTGLSKVLKMSILFLIIKQTQNVLLCSSLGMFCWLWSGTCGWKCWTPPAWLGSWFCLLVFLQGTN